MPFPTDRSNWFERMFIGLVRQLRWSYLPPLMVYLAAGISGLTAIVGTFFVKDYLGLSAAFLELEGTEKLVGMSNVIPLITEMVMGAFRPKMFGERHR